MAVWLKQKSLRNFRGGSKPNLLRGHVMGIQLTSEEQDEFLSRGHTIIVATIRKSGEPFMTPVWYVYRDGAFYVRTFDNSPKVQHIRRDSRVCVIVEDGEAWIDLRAVVANCDAEFLTDAALQQDIVDAFNVKYEKFSSPPSTKPNATRKHYARELVFIKLTPRPGELRSWYNRKLRMNS